MGNLNSIDIVIILLCVVIDSIFVAYFYKKNKSRKLNSKESDTNNIQEPLFIVTKVEKHNELYSKYTVENNFPNNNSGRYTYNTFVFFDTKGIYNVGDRLKLAKT